MATKPEYMSQRAWEILLALKKSTQALADETVDPGRDIREVRAELLADPNAMPDDVHTERALSRVFNSTEDEADEVCAALMMMYGPTAAPAIIAGIAMGVEFALNEADKPKKAQDNSWAQKAEETA